MSLNSVLDKLSAHNHDIIGCIVTQDDRVAHNLREPYEVVDARSIGDRAVNMLDLMAGLEDAAGEIDQVFLEMEAHSVYARRVGDGALVIVNKPMGRNAFKKVKVGVNLFIKPLEKAMKETGVVEEYIPLEVAPAPAPAEAPAPEAAAQPESASKRPVRYYRGVKY